MDQPTTYTTTMCYFCKGYRPKHTDQKHIQAGIFISVFQLWYTTHVTQRDSLQAFKAVRNQESSRNDSDILLEANPDDAVCIASVLDDRN